MHTISELFILLIVTFAVSNGKVYERCELARELLNVHEAPKHQLATWVCIAQHESQFNTSAVGTLNGDASSDHGIFQISDLYWCSPPGNGWACGLTCSELEDDNIEDDFICAKRIYREHKKLSGDGFNAWAVYAAHCSGATVQAYIQGCFDSANDTSKKTVTEDPTNAIKVESSSTSSSTPSTTTTVTTSTTTSTSAATSTLLNSLRPESKTVNHFRTEPNKPWYHWFSNFRWSH